MLEGEGTSMIAIAISLIHEIYICTNGRKSFYLMYIRWSTKEWFN